MSSLPPSLPLSDSHSILISSSPHFCEGRRRKGLARETTSENRLKWAIVGPGPVEVEEGRRRIKGEMPDFASLTENGSRTNERTNERGGRREDKKEGRREGHGQKRGKEGSGRRNEVTSGGVLLASLARLILGRLVVWNKGKKRGANSDRLDCLAGVRESNVWRTAADSDRRQFARSQVKSGRTELSRAAKVVRERRGWTERGRRGDHRPLRSTI